MNSKRKKNVVTPKNSLSRGDDWIHDRYNIPVAKMEQISKKRKLKNKPESSEYDDDSDYQLPVTSDIKSSLSHFLTYYCKRSTLHGLRYVSDSKKTLFERIFWFIAFILAVCFSIYFIVNLYSRFNNDPVIISYNPDLVYVEDIPFPAVFICNVNIPKKDMADYINQYGTDLEKKLLADYCNSMSGLHTETDNKDDVRNKDDRSEDWSFIAPFLLQVSQTCKEMITICQWQNVEVDCALWINAVWTDEGYCCAFNKLPSNISMKPAATFDNLNDSFPSRVIDWNLADGYPSDSLRTDWPVRSAGPGARLGLTLVLDAAIDQYFCSSTSSSGFKVLLASPLETPKLAQIGLFVSPGVETRLGIKANLIDVSEGLHGLSLEKRRCFFSHERHLNFYRSYSEKNCLLECQSNYTLSKCECVPYYLPMNNDTPVCGRSKTHCNREAADAVENSKLLYVLTNIHSWYYNLKNTHTFSSECNCLPGCNELAYSPFSITTAAIIDDNADNIFPNILGNTSFEYFKRNMAILHVFFRDKTFLKQTKSELYGFTEFISNTGGILGFFYGFSFISAIEILYYIFIRSTCHYFQMKKLKKKKKKQHIPYIR